MSMVIWARDCPRPEPLIPKPLYSVALRNLRDRRVCDVFSWLPYGVWYQDQKESETIVKAMGRSRQRSQEKVSYWRRWRAL